MIKYYTINDELTRTIPKNHLHPFNDIEKYAILNDTKYENEHFNISAYNDIQNEKRKELYQTNTDHLAFKVLAGEISKEDWITERQKIKDKYPKIVQ